MVGVLEKTSSVYGTSSDGYFSHLSQDLRIEQVVAGKASVGDVIPVKRIVRSSDSIPVVEFDATPLEVGGRYLVFLQQAKSIYVVGGGPQGQFAIAADGRVHGATSVMPAVDAFDGRTLSAAIQQVDALAP